MSMKKLLAGCFGFAIVWMPLYYLIGLTSMDNVLVLKIMLGTILASGISDTIRNSVK